VVVIVSRLVKQVPGLYGIWYNLIDFKNFINYVDIAFTHHSICNRHFSIKKKYKKTIHIF
jgi:hypothetical protein